MFHANGWTFTWIVTAVGATHVCLRKVEPAKIFDARRPRVGDHDAVRAPTVLIGDRERSGRDARRAPRGLRIVTAGAPPAAATIERVEGDLGWEITHVYGLTETAPFITICEPRPEHAALRRRAARGAEGASRGRAHHVRRAAGRRGRRTRGARTTAPASGRSSCAATS